MVDGLESEIPVCKIKYRRGDIVKMEDMMAGSEIKEFNKHCKNVLFEITQKFEGVDYKRLEIEYDFKEKELVRAEVVKLEEEYECSGELLEYYWSEFSRNDVDYKITMFYKDFDKRSGNLHVIPGYFQVWRKGDTTSLFTIYKTESSIDLTKTKGKCSSGSCFCEEGWIPSIDMHLYGKDIPMVINTDNKNIFSELFWYHFDSIIGDRASKENIILLRDALGNYRKASKGVFSNMVSDFAKKVKSHRNKLNNNIECERLRITTGKNTYQLLKWINIKKDNQSTGMYTMYKIVYVEKQGFFYIFDNQTHEIEYQRLYVNDKNCNFNTKGPNQFDMINQKWVLNYHNKNVCKN